MANELERVAEILLKEAIKLKDKISLSDENQIKPLQKEKQQKTRADSFAIQQKG